MKKQSKLPFLLSLVVVAGSCTLLSPKELGKKGIVHILSKKPLIKKNQESKDPPPDPNEQLIEGAKTGNLHMLRSGWNSGADPSVTNHKGQGIFVIAMENENFGIISQLSEWGIGPQDCFAWEKAIENPDRRLFWALTKGKPSLNIHCKNGNTPLILAVIWGDPELVSKLLELGASPTLANTREVSAMEFARTGANKGNFPDSQFNYKEITTALNKAIIQEIQ